LFDGYSVDRLVMYTFPEHSWQQWRFKFAACGTAGRVAFVSNFIKHIEELLVIKKVEDWRYVQMHDLHEFWHIFERLGGLRRMLKLVYPHFDLNEKNSLQSHLRNMVDSILPRDLEQL